MTDHCLERREGMMFNISMFEATGNSTKGYFGSYKLTFNIHVLQSPTSKHNTDYKKVWMNQPVFTRINNTDEVKH